MFAQGTLVTLGCRCIALACYALGWVLLNRTRFGQSVFAVGDGEDAAALMGLRVPRVKIAVYVLSAVLAGSPARSTPRARPPA